ncbi:MAG: hypothetical protein AAFS02_09630 [Pseudomonadota bacterium]
MIAARPLCLAGLLLVSGMCGARCTNEPAETYLEELNRIGACLQEQARRPDNINNSSGVGYDEMRLYTWGPEVKIRRMQTDPYFCDFEYARQREFEAIKFYDLAQANVLRWYGWQPPGAASPVRTLSALAALKLATADQRRLSLQFVFPQWFRRTPGVAAREMAVREAAAALGDAPASPARSIAEGRVAAYDAPFDGRPSAIRGGLGVYFSADPFRYHNAETRGHGLVCRTPSQRVIVDVANQEVRDALVDKQILYTQELNLPASSIVNQIENPVAFDEAARGDIILRVDFGDDLTGQPRSRAYVDKCSIQYTTCEPISVSVSGLSCTDFRRLVPVAPQASDQTGARPPAPEAFAPALLSTLASRPSFAEEFDAQLHKCLGRRVDDALLGQLEAVNRSELAQALREAAAEAAASE